MLFQITGTVFLECVSNVGWFVMYAGISRIISGNWLKDVQYLQPGSDFQALIKFGSTGSSYCRALSGLEAQTLGGGRRVSRFWF